MSDIGISNLELEQPFNPEKLYTYLRNHHWKDGITTEFLQEGVQMNISKYKLLKTDNDDFHSIFQKLNIPNKVIINLFNNILNKIREINNIP